MLINNYWNLIKLLIIPILITSSSITVPLLGKKCPGNCINDVSSCVPNGGKILGYCTEDKACCDFSSIKYGSCDAVKSGLRIAYFTSPEYPDYSSGNLNCPFHFDIQDAVYDGILVEFIDVFTEGVEFGADICETDMIHLRGFNFWQPPARCGNLTGYAVMIDKTENSSPMNKLTILGLMTSRAFKWKIKITLVKHGDKAEHRSLASVSPTPILPKTHNLRQRQGEQITDADIENEEDVEMMEPLIVNGIDTNISSVPWQASLRTFYPDYMFAAGKNSSDILNTHEPGCSIEGRHFCGGSIISEGYILSAAHCFKPQSKLQGWTAIDQMRIYVGDTNLCFNDEVKYGRASQNFSLERIVFHYAYDNSVMDMHDVAVVKLKGKIHFNSYVKPITLAAKGSSSSGKQVLASGWGLQNLTSTVDIPAHLQSTDMRIINTRLCMKLILSGYKIRNSIYLRKFPKYFNVLQSVVCTYSNTSSKSHLVGQGDSGGPLVVLREKDEEGAEFYEPIQVGIVSYGLGVWASIVKHKHDNVFLDVYQNVSFYREWIDLNMIM